MRLDRFTIKAQEALQEAQGLAQAKSHQQRTIKTEPIDITVKKSAAPPDIQSSGEQLTL